MILLEFITKVDQKNLNDQDQQSTAVLVALWVSPWGQQYWELNASFSI